MQIKTYSRAIGITTIRTVIFIFFVFVWTVFLLERLPASLNILGIYGTFFVLSFLFAGWIFGGKKVPWSEFALTVFVTYVWDWLLSLLFYSWLLNENLFDAQRLLEHLIYLGLYIVAMVLGMTVKRRLFVEHSMAEGLES